MNVLPWWKLKFGILEQIMEKAVKPIIINQENDEHLTVELVTFALNPSLPVDSKRSVKKRYRDDGDEDSGRLKKVPSPLDNVKVATSAPQSASSKMDYKAYSPNQGSSKGSLWMAFKADPTSSPGTLFNFSNLIRDVQNKLEKMDINSRVFFQLSHGNLDMNLMQLIKGKFDINKIPWQYLSKDQLFKLLELSEQPIFINSENDYYLTPEFIEFAFKCEIIWKKLRSDGAALEIPNYMELMIRVAEQGIPEDNYLNALIWAVLTYYLCEDQRIVGAINVLSNRISVPDNLPQNFPVQYFGITVLHASCDVLNAPSDEELFSIYELISTSSNQRIQDTRVLIEHFPFSFSNIYAHLLEGELDLLDDYEEILTVGGDQYSRRMARAFFISLIHEKLEYDYHGDLIKGMINKL